MYYEQACKVDNKTSSPSEKKKRKMDRPKGSVMRWRKSVSSGGVRKKKKDKNEGRNEIYPGVFVYTMTLVGEVDGYVTPVEQYDKVFCDYLPAAKKKKALTQVRSGLGRFGNQYTICVPIREGTLLNVKIFKDGRVQVSGAKSERDAWGLKDILSQVGCMNVRNFHVAMINANMSFGRSIQLLELATHLRTMHLPVRYDTSRHPGLNVVYKHCPTSSLRNGLCIAVVMRRCVLMKRNGQSLNASVIR